MTLPDNAVSPDVEQVRSTPTTQGAQTGTSVADAPPRPHQQRWHWDGRSRSVRPVVVDPDVTRPLERAVLELVRRHPMKDLDDAALLVDIEAAARSLPGTLVATLVDFRLHGSADGVLLIRGLPVDTSLPLTPSSGQPLSSWSTLPVSTAVQLMLMSVLGDVIAYADEKAGSLVQEICPAPGAERQQENTGSCLLELHTEDGFHPNLPDFLGLFCLRSDHERQALTVASSIRAAWPRLSREHVEALRRPEFRLRLASSFTGPALRAYSAPAPVLSGPDGDPDLCVDFHATEPLTPAASGALAGLRSTMLDEMVEVALRPGDLLLVDNRKAVHGRTAFFPRYDGHDRWLRRCFVVASIRKSLPLRYPGSRVHRPIVDRLQEGT
jgi:L-asparagine oxygenase